jgi:chemotaxis protein histidine kinase CheA
MSTPDEIVAKELARLSANFLAQLPQELRAVEDEVAAWLDAPRDRGRYEVLAHRVHQLKGSGSTFGCPGISRAARTLEQRMGTYRREIDAGQRPATTGVESAMVQLQNEGRRAQTGLRSLEGDNESTSDRRR